MVSISRMYRWVAGKYYRLVSISSIYRWVVSNVVGFLFFSLCMACDTFPMQGAVTNPPPTTCRGTSQYISQSYIEVTRQCGFALPVWRNQPKQELSRKFPAMGGGKTLP